MASSQCLWSVRNGQLCLCLSVCLSGGQVCLFRKSSLPDPLSLLAEFTAPEFPVPLRGCKRYKSLSPICPSLQAHSTRTLSPTWVLKVTVLPLCSLCSFLKKLQKGRLFASPCICSGLLSCFDPFSGANGTGVDRLQAKPQEACSAPFSFLATVVRKLALDC